MGPARDLVAGLLAGPDGAGGGSGRGARSFMLGGHAYEGSRQLAEMTVQEAARRDLWLQTNCHACGHRSTTAARHYVQRWAGLRLWELQARMRCTGAGCGLRGGPVRMWGLPPGRG